MDVDVGVGVIVGLIIASSLYIYNNENFTKNQKIVLLLLFVFFPAQWLGIIIVLIYNSIQAKNSTDKVNERKIEQHKIILKSSISDLKDLKEKGILTESEYWGKVAKIKTEQIQQHIENSLEYKQLKGLRDSSILTKEEFESKVKLLSDDSNIEVDEKEISNIVSSMNSSYIKNSTEEYEIIDNRGLGVIVYLAFAGVIIAIIYKLFFKINILRISNLQKEYTNNTLKSINE